MEGALQVVESRWQMETVMPEGGKKRVYSLVLYQFYQLPFVELRPLLSCRTHLISNNCQLGHQVSAVSYLIRGTVSASLSWHCRTCVFQRAPCCFSLFCDRSHCVISKFCNPLPLPSKCSNYRYILPCATLEDMFYVLFYFICIFPLNNNVSFVSSTQNIKVQNIKSLLTKLHKTKISKKNKGIFLTKNIQGQIQRKCINFVCMQYQI